MGVFKVRITGAKRINASLTKHMKGVELGVQEGARMVAEDLLKLSSDLAPILTGALIKSGRVVVSRGQEGRKNFAVSYGTNHAVFAHEEISPAGIRGLGRLSQEKNANNKSPYGPVGGHFLSRPLQAKARRYLRFICAQGGRRAGFRLRGALRP